MSQLLRKTKVPRRTFESWKTEGLVPTPQMLPHPSGRGRIGLYPEWVEDRVRLVKDLKRRGLSVDAIKLHLWHEDRGERYHRLWRDASRLWFDWSEEKHGAEHGMSFKGTPLLEHYRDTIATALLSLGISDADLRRRMVEAASDYKARVHAVVLMLASVAPIAVFDADGSCRVIPSVELAFQQPLTVTVAKPTRELSATIFVHLLPILLWLCEVSERPYAPGSLLSVPSVLVDGHGTEYDVTYDTHIDQDTDIAPHEFPVIHWSSARRRYVGPRQVKNRPVTAKSDDRLVKLSFVRTKVSEPKKGSDE